MSNAPRQPAYHPEIITFIRWVEAASIKGTHDPTAVATRPFMPLSQLDKYLREGNRTKRLLQALFHPGQPPIEPEDVWQNCIIVFSILLLIGKGPFISEFIQHEELWDVKLPFSLRPSRFPPSPDGDRFFDSFFQQQWQFYPHTFRQNVINAQVENERVLPILDKQLLGEGSSAFIYKIKLHPDYDKLRNLGDSRRDSNHNHANTYVLKTYRFKDAKDSYETEVKAFKALLNGGSLGKSIIGFYGSYEQNGSYNALLEFADLGTLEDYLQGTSPPTTGEDIYKFWHALFNVIKGLKMIHDVRGNDASDSSQVLQGWHQDIKPTNILVCSGKSGSKYDCEFKIADLGLSHFRRARASAGAVTDKDSCGTREYGAPECYRFDPFVDSSPIRVGQNVDSWSLGCVFSEVAAWVVHGREGLEDYRQRRQDETQQLDDFRDGKAFHDGEAMLQCVGKMHNKVLQNKRFSDNVTGPVIETMITEMLDESEGRPNAKQLWAKSQRILRAAETKLKSTEWDPTENDKQHAKKVPPVTPPDLPHSQSERSGRRGVPRELSLAKQQLPIRSATYNVLAPEHTTSSPQPQEYDSPEDIDSTDPTPPTSPGDIQNGTNNQHQRLPSHPDPYRPGSLLERNQVIDDSPTPYSKFRKRGSARYGLRGSNHAHDQSLSGSMLGSNIRELNETSPMLALAEHQSSPHTPSDSWQRQPGHRIPNLTTSPRLAQRRVGRELPHLSIAEAEKWIFYTKQHGKSYPALEHKELLDELNRRDHVFLVDDAASMSKYWHAVISVISTLSYLLKDSDDDGMDLYFAISSTKYNSKKSEKLVQKLLEKEKELVGTSNVGLRLSTILHEYQLSLDPSVLSLRSLLSKAKGKTKKPLSVYILTDAVWQPHCNVAEPIRSLVETLRRWGYSRHQAGIQFIRFGHDSDGIEKLDHLDSGLQLGMDVVDSEPADGNVWKMLLGSINEWFDSDHTN